MFLENTNLKNLIYSGMAGGVASSIQLSSLYWIRTIIKYQYVYPKNLKQVSLKLWYHQDRFRFFRGFYPNLTKATLGKVGESSLIKHFNPEHNKYDLVSNTIVSASAITGWKMLMMPLDTLGNCYQVHGIKGKEIMKGRIKKLGYNTLWSGTLVYLNISFINYSIWIYVYHNLNHMLPNNMQADIRNGIIGLGSTFCSDIIVNPLRVLKTNIQSQKEKLSYYQLYQNVIVRENGLFRGLKTKMIFNCFNGSLYVILWKRLDEGISFFGFSITEKTTTQTKY